MRVNPLVYPDHETLEALHRMYRSGVMSETELRILRFLYGIGTDKRVEMRSVFAASIDLGMDRQTIRGIRAMALHKLWAVDRKLHHELDEIEKRHLALADACAQADNAKELRLSPEAVLEFRACLLDLARNWSNARTKGKRIARAAVLGLATTILREEEGRKPFQTETIHRRVQVKSVDLNRSKLAAVMDLSRNYGCSSELVTWLMYQARRMRHRGPNKVRAKVKPLRPPP